MKLDKESLNAFLNDKPFYKNDDCFCLGGDLTEAGMIVKNIIDANYPEKRSDGNVEVASE